MDFGQESGDDDAARQLIFDYRRAGFDDADLALCEFAERLTAAPGEIGAAEITRLREHGFTDPQISVATQVIGYFNYINRVADGLGVDPEPEMAGRVSEREWRRQKRQPRPAE